MHSTQGVVLYDCVICRDIYLVVPVELWVGNVTICLSDM